jgi:hypothetical protein
MVLNGPGATGRFYIPDNFAFAWEILAVAKKRTNSMQAAVWCPSYHGLSGFSGLGWTGVIVRHTSSPPDIADTQLWPVITDQMPNFWNVENAKSWKLRMSIKWDIVGGIPQYDKPYIEFYLNYGIGAGGTDINCVIHFRTTEIRAI